jgi:signal transduction histidine kinase
MHTFIQKTLPKDASSIVTGDLLTRLLDSYCFPLKKALTVYYKKEDANGVPVLGWIEIDEKKRETFNHPFCLKFRYSSRNSTHDDACKACDKEFVKQYYDGSQNGPKLTRCHLQLWDMTYPLKVHGSLVGVLYGGQIIVTQMQLDWAKSLKSISPEVSWPDMPCDGVESDQVSEIKKAIDLSKAVLDADKESLKQAACTPPVSGEVTIAMLLELYAQFKDFGKTLEAVLNNLAAAEREALRRQHIYECAQRISASANELSDDPGAFWRQLDSIVETTLPSVAAYVLFTSNPRGDKKLTSVHTRVFAPALFPSAGHLRKTLCRQIRNTLAVLTVPDVLTCNLKDVGAPKKFVDLFEACSSRKLSDFAMGIVGGVRVPATDASTTSILVYVSAAVEIQPSLQPAVASYAFYVESARDIVATLALTLSRHAIEQEQADAWAMRAHELLAPINAVQGYKDNLRVLFDRKLKPLLALAEDTCTADMFSARVDRLGMLCSILTHIARGTTLDRSKVRFQPSEIMSDVVMPIVQPLTTYAEQESGIRVELDTRAIHALPELHLFVSGLRHCLFNIVFNAIKYGNDNSVAYIGAEATEDSFNILVTNAGIGVLPEEEERIFRRFVQGAGSDKVSSYGMGLGLYMARRMARLHEGTVTVVSGVPAKTTFAIVLPKFLANRQPNPGGLVSDLLDFREED